MVLLKQPDPKPIEIKRKIVIDFDYATQMQFPYAWSAQ